MLPAAQASKREADSPRSALPTRDPKRTRLDDRQVVSAGDRKVDVTPETSTTDGSASAAAAAGAVVRALSVRSPDDGVAVDVASIADECEKVRGGSRVHLLLLLMLLAAACLTLQALLDAT
jgi:hypothetical protein